MGFESLVGGERGKIHEKESSDVVVLEGVQAVCGYYELNSCLGNSCRTCGNLQLTGFFASCMSVVALLVR